MSEDPERALAKSLLSAAAVHERTGALYGQLAAGRSDHFVVDEAKLGPLADTVAELTASRFPALTVPFHARWRHFEVGGVDRFRSLARARNWATPEETARAMGDLAIISVLLDAGAGPRWRYHEAASDMVIGRSEGLALASFAMFASGAFSAVPTDPLRADASALEDLTADEFSNGFQITDENPLEGAAGRLALLSDCAAALRERPDLFASQDDPRPGGLIDALAAEAGGSALPAEVILSFVLEGLGPIWPSRLMLGGVPLGDAWHHPSLNLGGPAPDIVPFHKLSTWLSLSLIEPLAARGVTVEAMDALPGLAEYRNGGLFVDGGVLALREPDAAQAPRKVDDPLIVEWRAATVALLSQIAPMVRGRLGANDLSLASILEGGTWLAGRQLAYARRPDGSPPIAIISDGTVF